MALLLPSANHGDPSDAAAANAVGIPSDEDELKALIPRGYPHGACRPSPDTGRDQAALTCGWNADAGGPATATYQLVGQQTPMTGAFAAVTATFARSDCPGNIQSPGPWHRASGQMAAGVVFCGYQDDAAIVAWSTDDERLLSVVRAEDGGPSLQDLFTWWSAHS